MGLSHPPDVKIGGYSCLKSENITSQLYGCFDVHFLENNRARGFKSRMCPQYPQLDRKRRLNGAVCRNHRIKRVVPCRCLDGHVKEPYEMSMALGARP